MSPCQLLKWDSNHFGFNIARLEGSTTDTESVQAALEWCRENRIRCLYFLSDFNDFVTTRVAEAHGFNLVDMRVTLEKNNWSIISPECAGLRVGLAMTADASELQAIGRFYSSRFYYDNRFDSQAVDRMYRLWIGKSLYGGADSVVLVGKLEGQVAGFVTYKCSTSEIVLVATDERLSGRGISTHLVSLAASQLHTAGSESVVVVTQARNCRAQSVYQRCVLL